MSNMIVLIFIIVFLLALYIFTNNPTPPVIVNNTSTIIKDTFKGDKPNNISKNSIGISNNSNGNGNSSSKSNSSSNSNGNNNSTNGSIVNSKIKIKNRDNSLLQQFIKDDTSTSTNTKKKEQNAKEFQKMLKDDLEKNVAGVYDTLKNISAPVIPNRIVTDDKYKVNNDKYIVNNDKYKGYNNYVSLRTDSYAPVTSIGKQLITPFASYPVAC